MSFIFALAEFSRCLQRITVPDPQNHGAHEAAVCLGNQYVPLARSGYRTLAINRFLFEVDAANAKIGTVI